ncbi:VanW family protein [Fictibacillus phosphorivorans]|uniref:VanW family protein n=1 Tax=Fictibacillus phosphorivorans TaxID=1221500 RepID=UPI00203F2548|nr:VanW family protein [Fictibacillus phosphorivorans]MCM3719062.1 VanW family protein [Fictibacillus phosphorivorans]MCM3776684.1 VanW family protein [Fictibacillus phosphorivorans]
MFLKWLTGLLLIAQPLNMPDSLTVNQQGKTIAEVNRPQFSVPIPGIPMIDSEKYERFIKKLETQTYKAPVNAKINDHGGIVPGEVGYKLNRHMFKENFYSYFFGEGSVKIDVPEVNLYPRVDTELLAHIKTQQVGQYITYFNSNNRSRSNNIELAAKALDSHVVFPGETFSFNQVVGNRTIAKGYMRAPIIVRGELSEGVGGGICQVSSTLFNAVDRAGLTIVQRYSHSKRVPYVPPGRDATVSWYGPDFQFKNQYNQPILIRAKRYGGSMMVKLFSSDVINMKKRKVPNAPTSLPKEIHVEQNVHLSNPER